MLNRMSHVAKSYRRVQLLTPRDSTNESQSVGRGLLIAAATSAVLWAAIGAVVVWGAPQGRLSNGIDHLSRMWPLSEFDRRGVPAVRREADTARHSAEGPHRD
jgi:hypothetical protein